MKIHITGGRGYLGGAVARALAETHTVVATDIDTMDITNPTQVKAVLGKNVPDILVHLAALKGNRPSRENPVEFYRVNTMGTLHLLEACRLYGITRFIFVSSLTVHGPQEQEVTEASPMYPIHPYGASKAAAEAYVQAYASSYGLTAIILRPNFIVGAIPPPAPYVDNIVYDFITAIEQTGKITLAGDGSFEREWIHPEDVACAVQLGVTVPVRGCEAFVLGANRVSMKALAERIVALIGRGTVVADPSMPGFSLVAAAEKARRVLGWVPRRDLATILEEIWSEYQQRKGHPYYRH